MGTYFKCLVCSAGMLREGRQDIRSSLGNNKPKEKQFAL